MINLTQNNTKNIFIGHPLVYPPLVHPTRLSKMENFLIQRNGNDCLYSLVVSGLVTTSEGREFESRVETKVFA